MSMSTTKISKTQWNNFLQTFSGDHHGWLAQLETHDTATGETVISPEMFLWSIELDLEDEANPRINVNVKYDNKEIKHILFLPSDLTLNLLQNSREAWLRIDSVNTSTTVRLRPPAFESKEAS